MQLRHRATMNPHSAVSHLSHFCNIISRSGSVDNRPIYDIDPPDFSVGWHEAPTSLPAFQGPWSSTVTLPRSLPIPRRSFTTQKPYPTKLAAHRHAAFEAYKALKEWDLLNEHLLPFTGGKDVGLEEEVKKMLSEVEKREGMVGVSMQIDPWAATLDGGSRTPSPNRTPDGSSGHETPEKAEVQRSWYVSEMKIDGSPPLLFFTLRPMDTIPRLDGPKLYRPGRDVVRVEITPLPRSSLSFPAASFNDMAPVAGAHTPIPDDDEVIAQAREYTRMIFCCFYGSRLKWDNTDYSYLVLPPPQMSSLPSTSAWTARRAWLRDLRTVEATLTANGKFRSDLAYEVRTDEYVREFGYTEDLVVVKKHLSLGRPWKFVGWRFDRLSEEEEEVVREQYRKQLSKGKAKDGNATSEATMGIDQTTEGQDVTMEEMDGVEDNKMDIPYPLLIAEPFPPRTNFLHPLPESATTSPRKDEDETGAAESASKGYAYLIPSMSGVALYSEEETEYAFLLPSILRWLGIDLTVSSFRKHHWTPSSSIPGPLPEHSPTTSLRDVPNVLLTVALTAPMSGERYNYQRLETLGDTVLKFVVGIQMYDEYPMWHEGYLTRGKDHAVSNVKLAKENFSREVFRWIIRGMFTTTFAVLKTLSDFFPVGRPDVGKEMAA